MKSKFSIIILYLLSTLSYAQGNSPLSFYGPGEFLGSTFQSNFTKSGIGVSSATPNMLNPINPATYSNLTLTTGETGIYSSTNFLSANNTQAIFSDANLSGFGLGFPLGNSFGAAFGLTAHTRKNYNFNYTKTLSDGNDVEEIYAGEGGLSKLFLGVGTSINNFSFGANGHYIFGRLNNISKEKYASNDFQSIRFQHYTNVSGFSFNAGMQYKLMFTTQNYFVLGSNYDLGGSHNTSNYTVGNYFSIGQATNTNNQIVDAEFHETTPVVDTRENPIKNQMTLPSALQFGFSTGKLDHWEASIEFKKRMLNEFLLNGVSSNFNEANTIMLGGSIIPNKKALGRSNYWKTTTYNFGLQLGNSGIEMENEELNEFGINFGLGFPLKKFKYQTETFGSSIFLSFGYLNRFNENLGVSENYININASVVLNDKWFIKRKFK